LVEEKKGRCLEMFFSMRKDSDDEFDSPIAKKNKVSLSSVVKKMNESKSPEKKREVAGTGLLSVVTTLTTFDPAGKGAGLSSEMLVKKLFQGMGLPLYKSDLPPEYQKDEIPPAIKDYRWGAYDLPIYHDTMLSIVRPPTPPPEPEPELQQSLRLTNGPSTIQEEANTADVVTPRKEQATEAPTKYEVEEDPVVFAPAQSSRTTPGSSKQRGRSSGKAATQVPSEETLGAPETEGEGIAERGEEGATQSRSKKKKSREKRSSRKSSEDAEPQQQQPEDVFLVQDESLSSSVRAMNMRSSAAERGESAADTAEAEMSIEDLNRELERQFKGRSAKKSRGTPKHASGSGSARAGVSSSGEEPLEELLRLDSPGSQWRFLKSTTPPGESAQDATAAQGAEQAVQSGRSEKPVMSPLQYIPPAPQAVQGAWSPSYKAQQSSRSAQDSEGAAATSAQPAPAPTKAEGKIISPAARSIFRPTFAAPRPDPQPEPEPEKSHPKGQDPIAAMLVSELRGSRHVSLNAEEHALGPHAVDYSPNRKKNNAFAVLEESFLNESPPYQVNNANYAYLQGNAHAQHQAAEREGFVPKAHDIDEQEINFKKFSKQHRAENAQDESHSVPKHGKTGHKHASPTKHWYMAGAYSSHSEAVEAIQKLNRVVDVQGVDPGNDGGGAEGRFRLQRDLSRMQWVVESNDAHNKALILAHSSGRGSHEKEKYRNIVQSLHKDTGAASKQAFHERQWDDSPPRLLAPHEKKLANKKAAQGEPKRDDHKYLRERDQYHENNLRLIRQQIPKEEAGSSPTYAHAGKVGPAGAHGQHPKDFSAQRGDREKEGGVKFPAIPQAQQGQKGQGGKGKKRGK
jgi:hypothetical protein